MHLEVKAQVCCPAGWPSCNTHKTQVLESADKHTCSLPASHLPCNTKKRHPEVPC